ADAPASPHRAATLGPPRPTPDRTAASPAPAPGACSNPRSPRRAAPTPPGAAPAPGDARPPPGPPRKGAHEHASPAGIYPSRPHLRAGESRPCPDPWGPPPPASITGAAAACPGLSVLGSNNPGRTGVWQPSRNRSSMGPMHNHIVYAHPSASSLNAALRDETVRALDALGHTTTVRALHAMQWTAAADYDDFGPTENGNFMAAAGEAYQAGAQSADITAEQERLLAADTLILQFPLWWFSMPAIMKGWVDRVFTNGFGYGATRTWKR